MQAINRAALVLRPAEPYIRWASSVSLDGQAVAAFLRDERICIYLVPEDPSETEETAPLEGFYKQVFEWELGVVTQDRLLWPRRRTLAMFEEWFHVRGESLIIDLVKGPIVHERF